MLQITTFRTSVDDLACSHIVHYITSRNRGRCYSPFNYGKWIVFFIMDV